MLAGARSLVRCDQLPDEGSGECEGKQGKHGASGQEEQDVLEPAFARQAGWFGLEEHERAEGKAIARASPDEVKKNGPGDGQATK